MSLFKQKECTDEAISAFWTWFASNEVKLSEKDGVKRAHVLKDAQAQLQILFPACPGSVSFSVIPSGGRWEISFSYGTKPVAKRTARRMRVLMPVHLQGKWRMEVSE